MRHSLPLALAALVGLAGCDAVSNQVAEFTIANEPTLVFSAGYQIDVGGRPVPIQGYDECPKAGAVMVKLFGPDPLEGKTTCIVLAKDRKTVPVLVALPSGTVQEDWKIVRETGKTEDNRPYARTSLTRPDGTPVVPWAATHPKG